MERFEASESRAIRILDPACGDGQLLDAAIEALRRVHVGNWQAVGVETDSHALTEARKVLARHDAGFVDLVLGNFLELATVFQPQQDLWLQPPRDTRLRTTFDIVIANPPYVRTQVLGAAEAQRIASRFNLSGRVDLYHAFIRAMALALRRGGVLGLITSNRFMTTLAGKAIRSFLAREFELLEVIDLGDTKLFEAAVLPALLVARRRNRVERSGPLLVPFTRVYSSPGNAQDSVDPQLGRSSILEAIALGDEGLVQVPQGTFAITRGRFSVAPGTHGVWELVSSKEAGWLSRIRDRSGGTVGDAALVRVGIKTTADQVFIRNDWASLPPEQRPENELLRPILSHDDAYRWAMPDPYVPTAHVLYPHVATGRGKRAIDLGQYPRAREYLQGFRSRLEARRYVIEAGRKWYEIWVPQDPGAWRLPKIVFPDISPAPKFCLVADEYVVNGDCYWITLRPGLPDETLYLILGIANSALMTWFHDAAFNNKLYSGRRRYITQYVAQYPLPPVGTAPAQRIASLARRLVEDSKRGAPTHRIAEMECAIDVAVCEAFGIDPEEAMVGTRFRNC
jgi:tRNA1(Val) A37 N6-methylase TrmN6